MGKEDESVLVVSRELIIPEPWCGIKTEGLGGFEELVQKYSLFKRREDVEEDSNWKQIIPYLIFKYRGRYLLMQRTDQGDEKRLYNRYSLGIGGHIREEDLGGKTVAEWAAREFQEEMDYDGSYTSRPLGLLNDDSNPVGQVHLGYVVLLDGNSEKINVRDEHQSGKLSTLDEMEGVYLYMESWSQLVYDFFKKAKTNLTTCKTEGGWLN